MKAPTALVGVVLLGVIAGAVWWWWPANPDPDTWQGYADADFVRIGPPLQGLLTEVPVKAGDTVKAGQLLFAQDDRNDVASRDEIAARVREGEARLENLQATSRDQEIAQAEADLADNKAVLDRTNRDLERAEMLVKSHVVSVQQRDQARADALSAAAKVRAMEAALALKKSPTGRTQEVQAQTAVLAENRAQLAQAEWRLAQRRMTAPTGGLISDVYGHVGETPGAGVPVVSLLPPENLLVRFFVPETALATVHAGTPVAIACDACKPNLSAVVSFVSPRSEYTPPVIYSEATRGKLVYLVEARPTPPDVSVLKPGQPVTVRPAP
jgi:HlyD family secretion protein